MSSRFSFCFGLTHLSFSFSFPDSFRAFLWHLPNATSVEMQNAHCLKTRVETWHLLKTFVTNAILSLLDAAVGNRPSLCLCPHRRQQEGLARRGLFGLDVPKNTLKWLKSRIFFPHLVKCWDQRDSFPPSPQQIPF